MRSEGSTGASFGAMRETQLPAPLCFGVAAGLVARHFALLGPFFPNASGGIGNDYSYFLPHLLDGFFWFRENGPFAVPWFTPSFCAGMPKFPNPQALYFSFPQLATLLTDPLTALKLTSVAFFALGFWGFHLLLRRCFGCSRATALLGGTLFLFNGMSAARLLVEHLTFHAFMLSLLLCYLLLRPLRADTGDAADARWRAGRDVALAGLVIAYTATTGLPHVLLPLLLATLAVALLRLVADPERLRGPRLRDPARALGRAGPRSLRREAHGDPRLPRELPARFLPARGCGLRRRPAGAARAGAVPRRHGYGARTGRRQYRGAYRARGLRVQGRHRTGAAAARRSAGLGRRSHPEPRVRPAQWAVLIALELVLALPLALNY